MPVSGNVRNPTLGNQPRAKPLSPSTLAEKRGWYGHQNFQRTEKIWGLKGVKGMGRKMDAFLL